MFDPSQQPQLEPKTDWLLVLSVVSGWASIVGLGISSYAAWGIRKIQRRYLLGVRAPDLVESLAVRASNIITLAPLSYEKKVELELELTAAAVALGSLKDKIGWLAGRKARVALRRIKTCRKKWLHRDQVERVYIAIQGVIMDMEERAKDEPWKK